MKTKIMALVLVALVINAFGTDEKKYTETMTNNIQLIYKASTPDELQLAINVFDRVGNAEKTKWEPFYYQAFGYIMLANREEDGARKDAFLDQAKAALDKASTINPNESEIVAMEGFISMIRVTVDPATRGQKYSASAMQYFSKAIALNPENPRALALMAQMQFGTARFFNSSTADACATLSNAIEKFATYKTDNPLAPQWGKGMADGLKAQCM